MVRFAGQFNAGDKSTKKRDVCHALKLAFNLGDNL
jgi:hypothetical protein